MPIRSDSVLVQTQEDTAQVVLLLPCTPVQPGALVNSSPKVTCARLLIWEQDLFQNLLPNLRSL